MLAFCSASVVKRDICPDQATPELMELSARLGSLMPYRKAADVMAEFLPVPPTESFVAPRHRTLTLGRRLDGKARQREWFEPPQDCGQRQIELDLPDDPERECVVSIDTAHVRGGAAVEGRTLQIAVALWPRRPWLASWPLLCHSGHLKTRHAVQNSASSPA